MWQVLPQIGERRKKVSLCAVSACKARIYLNFASGYVPFAHPGNNHILLVARCLVLVDVEMRNLRSICDLDIIDLLVDDVFCFKKILKMWTIVR